MAFRQLTVQQAAARLHLTVQAVEQLVKYQELPFSLRGEATGVSSGANWTPGHPSVCWE